MDCFLVNIVKLPWPPPDKNWPDRQKSSTAPPFYTALSGQRDTGIKDATTISTDA